MEPLIIQGRKMSHTLALNEQDSTLQLIEQLNLAINEARLVSRIMDMNHRAENIESTTGSSMRTWRLREESKQLEIQLDFIRSRKTQIINGPALI